MAKSTTTIFKSFVKNTVGYFVKKVTKTAMLKDFKNAALFSVVQLGIDLGFGAIRNKEIGSNAQYALSATIEYTQWMSKLENSEERTARNLDAPTKIPEEEEEDETEPIYLSVFQKMPRFFQKDDADDTEKEESGEIVVASNITLNAVSVERLFNNTS